MAKSPNKKHYLNDFKMNAEGDYIYHGQHVTLNHEDRKQIRIKHLGFLLIIMAFIIGSGCINAGGMNNTFYVIIPYILEVASLFVLEWNGIRLFSSNKETIREYVYLQTKDKIPVSCITLCIFAAVGFAGSLVYTIINSFEDMTVLSILYLISKVIDIILVSLYRKSYLSLEWEYK